LAQKRIATAVPSRIDLGQASRVANFATPSGSRCDIFQPAAVFDDNAAPIRQFDDFRLFQLG